jgi:hypothetical protein
MGLEYARHFQFCILETADTNASEEDVIDRETHWEKARCSWENHGSYNTNCEFGTGAS